MVKWLFMKKQLIKSLKVFTIYFATWLILSGGVMALFPFVFITLLSIITPYIFTLNYGDISFRAIAKLIFLFFIYSLKGGVQVAVFALKPRLKLQPHIYHYPLKTKSQFATSMLANLYSVMPGTISMGYNDSTLTLHILDQSLFDKELISTLELHMIEAFERGLE